VAVANKSHHRTTTDTCKCAGWVGANRIHHPVGSAAVGHPHPVGRWLWDDILAPGSHWPKNFIELCFHDGVCALCMLCLIALVRLDGCSMLPSNCLDMQCHPYMYSATAMCGLHCPTSCTAARASLSEDHTRPFKLKGALLTSPDISAMQ